MYPMEWDISGTAKRLAELLVAVGLIAAQVEIAVYSMHIIAHFIEQNEQRHTVCTTAQSNEI